MTSTDILNGRRIRQAREDRGWTQTDLARQLARTGYRGRTGQPVSQKTLSSIELGRHVPARMRGPLTRALRATADHAGLHLLNGEDLGTAEADGEPDTKPELARAS